MICFPNLTANLENKGSSYSNFYLNLFFILFNQVLLNLVFEYKSHISSKSYFLKNISRFIVNLTFEL